MFFSEDKEVLNFSQSLNRKVVFFKQKAAETNIRIKTCIPEKLYLQMDAYALDCILNNLFDNAIKYNMPGGEVIIKLFKNKKTIFLTIKNTGFAIPNEQWENIFKPYYQLSHKKKNYQGIGMGLSIVKKIVLEASGKIYVESSSLKGTLFIIELPDYVPGIYDGFNKFSDDLLSYSYSSQTIKLPDEEYDEFKSTIFVIDDNKDMVKFLYTLMSDEYNFFYALNGNSALKKLKIIPFPDIIICDIMMDEMDGYDFHNIIKNHKHFNSIPFIFLSAKSKVKEKLKALSNGAIDFIEKPFSADELMAKIESMLTLVQLKEEKIGDIIKQRIVHSITKQTNMPFSHIRSKFHLNPKEIKLIQLIKENYQHKEIAHKLNLSEQTIKNIAHTVYKKCGVNSKEKLLELIEHSIR